MSAHRHDPMTGADTFRSVAFTVAALLAVVTDRPLALAFVAVMALIRIGDKT